MISSFSWGVLLLFCMNVVAGAFIPMPINVVMLWMGQYHHPYLLIVASTLGAVLGWLLFHPHIYREVHKRPKWTAKIPKVYYEWFGNHIAFWLFVFNALPIPLDIMRLIAATKQHPPLRLAWAIGLGRLIRNTTLVFFSVWLSHHQQYFWGVIALILLLPLAVKGAKLLRDRFALQPAAQEL